MGNDKQSAIQDFMMSNEIKHSTFSNQNKCWHQSAFSFEGTTLDECVSIRKYQKGLGQSLFSITKYQKGLGVYDGRTKTKTKERQEKVNFVYKKLLGRALISSLHTYRSNKITRVFRWFSHAPCSGPYV